MALGASSKARVSAVQFTTLLDPESLSVAGTILFDRRQTVFDGAQREWPLQSLCDNSISALVAPVRRGGRASARFLSARLKAGAEIKL